MVEVVARRGSGGGGAQALARVIIHEAVLKGILAHATSDTTREVGGVLVGSLVGEPGEHVVEVSGWIAARHTEASRTSVTFTPDTWAAVHEEKERRYPDERIVGWYHTHPNLGIFLSQHDLFIHRNFFREPWQVALVVDPVREERGFFVWLREGDIRSVPYFILAQPPGRSLLPTSATRQVPAGEARQAARVQRPRQVPVDLPETRRRAASLDGDSKVAPATRSREEAVRRLEAARAYALVQRTRVDPLSLLLVALTVALAVGMAVTLVSLLPPVGSRGVRSPSSEDGPWTVQVEQVRMEMARSESRLEALRGEMDALRLRVDQLQGGAGDVRERLDSLGAGLDEVRAGVEQAREELEQLRRGMDELRDRAVRVHVVQRGDTLWGLSQRYYGSPAYVNLLMRANDIPRDGTMRAGRMIVVPTLEGSRL